MLLLRVALLISLFLIQTESAYVTVTYETIESYSSCVWEGYYSWRWRWWWLWWEWYYDKRLVCNTYYKTVTLSKQVCAPGWTGYNCNTPICSSCNPGETCVEPQKCQCLKSRGVCEFVPCDLSLSCFPGTCIGSSCKCPPNFEGSDCEKILDVPDIETCKVTIHSNDQHHSTTVNCDPIGHVPWKNWINYENIKEIVLEMGGKEHKFLNLPDSSRAAFVTHPVAIGVASGKMNVTKNGLSIGIRECVGLTATKPSAVVKCLEKIVSLKVTHNDNITVEAIASYGGYKRGSKNSAINSSFFPEKSFTGIETKRSALFQVDTKPPEHCFETELENCFMRPVHLLTDVISKKSGEGHPLIKPEFRFWEDSDSGIKEYNVSLFRMHLHGGILDNSARPLESKIFKPEDIDKCSFICTESGVYSIETRVYDYAGNVQKARNIFIYSESSNLNSNPDHPIEISGAIRNEKSNIYWITNSASLKKNEIVIKFDKHFVSEAKFSNEWLQSVRSWDSGYDDIAIRHNSSKYLGHRTIDAMDHGKNGIEEYTLNYVVDKTNGGLHPNYTNANVSKKVEFKIPTDQLEDGDTVSLKLQCTDLNGEMLTEELKVRVDTSKPVIRNHTYVEKDPDEYASRIYMRVEDKESGIEKIEYKIYLHGIEAPIKTLESEVKFRDPPTNRAKRELMNPPCNPGDESCYCTPYEVCFDYQQIIEVDHCVIDKHQEAHKIRIVVLITNQAQLITNQYFVELNNKEPLRCRPVFKLTVIQVVSIVISCLVFMALLVAVLAFIVRIYLFKKPVPRMMTNAYGNIRNRMSRYRAEPVTSPNDLYLSSDEAGPKTVEFNAKSKDDVKLLMDKTSSKNDVKIIESSRINFGPEIHKGRIMIITKGQYLAVGKKLDVAIKCCKNGVSKKEKSKAENKIIFLANLPPHENIPKVFGIIQTETSKSLVMEFCDWTLQSWLNGKKKVTPEVLDDMLLFAINIARAVQFLHANNIIHKRIAMRNVIISKQNNQNVAKLIGFGSKDSDDDDDDKAVPLKWLAPETLDSLDSRNPVYTEKSDAWSYGIFLWEMYTLGRSAPYPNLGSKDAKTRIASGLKMDQPEHCPPEIYKNVMDPCWECKPRDRPNFSSICGWLDDFKSGGESNQAGYYSSK